MLDCTANSLTYCWLVCACFFPAKHQSQMPSAEAAFCSCYYKAHSCTSFLEGSHPASARTVLPYTLVRKWREQQKVLKLGEHISSMTHSSFSSSASYLHHHCHHKEHPVKVGPLQVQGRNPLFFDRILSLKGRSFEGFRELQYAAYRYLDKASGLPSTLRYEGRFVSHA